MKLPYQFFSASTPNPLVNSSTVPNSPQYVSTATLSSFYFNEEVISKIVNALNTDKAHGNDDISIWIIKLCSKPVFKSLSIIFKSFIDAGTFPDIWRRVTY